MSCCSLSNSSSASCHSPSYSRHYGDSHIGAIIGVSVIAAVALIGFIIFKSLQASSISTNAKTLIIIGLISVSAAIGTVAIAAMSVR